MAAVACPLPERPPWAVSADAADADAVYRQWRAVAPWCPRLTGGGVCAACAESSVLGWQLPGDAPLPRQTIGVLRRWQRE